MLLSFGMVVFPMARITVEQVALTDTRYVHLGRLYKKDRLWALGVMVFIWNQCQELEKYCLTPEEISYVHEGIKRLPENLVLTHLAELQPDGSLYIRGTKGIIEWLAERRKDGKKGGRPHNPMVNPMVLPQNNPPVPVPVPVPVQDTKNTLPLCKGLKKGRELPKGKIDYPEDFQRFWNAYPNPTSKKAAYKEWLAAKDKPPLNEIIAAIEKQKAYKAKRSQAGQFVPEWPDPERWIKKGRWEDKPFDPEQAAKDARKAHDDEIRAQLRKEGLPI
jgi:hypothetical protein